MRIDAKYEKLSTDQVQKQNADAALKPKVNSTPAGATESVSGPSNVNLSGVAQEINQLTQAAAAAAEIGAERIAELREQIQSGQYQVQHDELAARFLDRSPAADKF